ncbi:Protein TusC [Bienertia sinuspersici]
MVFVQVEAFPITVMFGMCSIFLFVASILQRRLLVIAESQRPTLVIKDMFCCRASRMDSNEGEGPRR